MDLAVIWFLLWGLLWAVYFITDGYDLGIGVLLPILGRDENKKRIMHRVVGPLWDGNEVWLLTAGGVTFAAFPKMYAVMFSAFYSPLMILLFSLIYRGVSFEFREQHESPKWKKIWDTGFFLGSLLPAILLGVAFANIFRGIPIDADGVLRGNLLTFLNPYGLLGGLLFLLMFLLHGTLMLAIKTEGDLQQESIRLAKLFWAALLVIAVVFLGATIFATSLFEIYFAHPLLFLVLIVAVGSLLLARYFLAGAHYWRAWAFSAAAITGVVFFGVIGLYPDMLPSSLDPLYSVTVAGAASSSLTLTIMLVLALIFVPVVIAYQVWVNHMFRGKVTEKDLNYEDAY